MCSGSGARGNWTPQQVFQEINSLLDRLAQEDVTAVPAESMGEDQIALQRIGNRVHAEALRRLRREVPVTSPPCVEVGLVHLPATRGGRVGRPELKKGRGRRLWPGLAIEGALVSLR